MTVSIFQLFSIGLGPSSSHTVGPMKAALTFVSLLQSQHLIAKVDRIVIEVFGSLAFTGKGHGTDYAILLGLENHTPDNIDPSIVKPRAATIIADKTLHLGGQKTIAFDYLNDFIFNFKDQLPLHTNAMRFSAFNAEQSVLLSKIYYSVGGGFIVDESSPSPVQPSHASFPFPFTSAKELIAHCESNQLSIEKIMLANECTLCGEEEVINKIFAIADVMQACINKGCQNEGILPGGLNITRRAPSLFQKLKAQGRPESNDHTDSMGWLNLFAIAVNEENAAGGRVVTAPTNGAAGIIPAVLHYYLTFYQTAKKADTLTFLLTAGAIAILYKKGASLSGAEVGCQGEVGVACSMAAAALTAVLGGNIYQIENAAEIAMEHHLGMTCDPIGGLVQIPCIERNAMGAVKAVNAARLALLGDGKHFVSLDKVIATMKQTGKDMLAIYKETSQGGLAANLPEC